MKERANDIVIAEKDIFSNFTTFYGFDLSGNIF